MLLWNRQSGHLGLKHFLSTWWASAQHVKVQIVLNPLIRVAIFIILWNHSVLDIIILLLLIPLVIILEMLIIFI